MNIHLAPSGGDCHDLLADDDPIEWGSEILDAEPLSADEHLEAIEAWERIKRSADAAQLRHIHALALDCESAWMSADNRRDFLAQEIGCALKWSDAQTLERIEVAETLS